MKKFRKTKNNLSNKLRSPKIQENWRASKMDGYKTHRILPMITVKRVSKKGS